MRAYFWEHIANQSCKMAYLLESKSQTNQNITSFLHLFIQEVFID